MESDLDQFERCLNDLKGACYRVRLADLLATFQEQARLGQVLIRQPDVVGLFYAQNQKKGCYTGFFRNIGKKEKFDL